MGGGRRGGGTAEGRGKEWRKRDRNYGREIMKKVGEEKRTREQGAVM